MEYKEIKDNVFYAYKELEVGENYRFNQWQFIKRMSKWRQNY